MSDELSKLEQNVNMLNNEYSKLLKTLEKYKDFDYEKYEVDLKNQSEISKFFSFISVQTDENLRRGKEYTDLLMKLEELSLTLRKYEKQLDFMKKETLEYGEELIDLWEADSRRCNYTNLTFEQCLECARKGFKSFNDCAPPIRMKG